jgi:glycosyltransferase involved in cell wall biosynthesis
MMAKSRKWAINGDFVTLKPTGVARYAREVTLALDALIAARHPLAADLDLSLLAPRPPGDLPLRQIPVRVIPEFDTPRLPQVWVQLQLPRHVDGGLLSFCNLAPMFKRRHIACIHDLHTWIMPESYGRLFRLVHRVVLPVLGRSAARITTVSHLSRDHLIKYAVAPAEKISVTYNGSDHALRWNQGASRLQLASRRPFVFCLGRSQRYKNTELMWRLAPALDQMGVDIAIAGDIDQAALDAFALERPRNIRLLGRISDDDFANVLSKALCLLFPSRIEGFGLPAAEAMALGCPIIASTAPCLPEVCGDAALYAGPDDPDAWIAGIHRLLSEPQLRGELVTKGLERAKAYSWRTIAESYLTLMARVDRGEMGAADSGHPSAVSP